MARQKTSCAEFATPRAELGTARARLQAQSQGK